MPNSGCSVIGSLGKHVEAGAADLAGLDRVLERGVVDQLAARAVDDPHAVLHLRERLGVHEVRRLGGLGQVDRDDVGARVEVLGGLGPLDAQLPVALGRRRTGRRRARSCRSLRALGHELADPAEAEDAERLLVDLDAAELAALPLAALQRRVRLRDVARLARASSRSCARPPRSMFDSGALATMMPRLVAAGTSTLSTPMPGAADHLQPVGPLDHVGGQLGGRADHDRVVVADRARQLAVVPCRSARRRRSARAAGRRRRRRSSP